jgi:hypothetical protein
LFFTADQEKKTNEDEDFFIRPKLCVFVKIRLYF